MIRSIATLVVVLATGSASPVLASTFRQRTEFFNANMFQMIDADTGMSFSAWRTKSRTSERDGGKPEIVESSISGYCFIITTCAAAGSCREDTRDCGDLANGAITHRGSTIRIVAPGFLYEYAVERRGLITGSRRELALSGSLTEDQSRIESTDGTGTLTSPYGSYSGFGYHNEGFTRHKAESPDD